MIKLSKRARDITPSHIRNNSDLRADSCKIYHLNIGQPDLEPPKEFVDGIIKYSNDPFTYVSAQGIDELRDAWSKHINLHYNTTLSKDDFLITSGSSEALMIAFNTCCDVGEEILVLSPSYGNYIGFSTMTGVKLVPVPCVFDGNFRPPANLEEIVKRITPKTRALLVCNPNNPTGTVLTEDELKKLAGVCKEHDMFLIVDEVYRELVYDNRTPRTSLSLSEYSQNVVVLDSLSKRFSLCGARIGCLISKNEEFMSSAINFASVRVSTNILEQKASEHLLTNLPDIYIPKMVQEYKNRRDTLVKHLKKIPNIELNIPQGGFYIFAKLPVNDSEDFCKFMEYKFDVNGCTVAVAPAKGFYINDSKPLNNGVRIAFVLSSQDLVKAVDIIQKALEIYGNKTI